MLKGANETVATCHPTWYWYIEIDADMNRRYGHEPKATFDLLFDSGYKAYIADEKGGGLQIDEYIRV